MGSQNPCALVKYIVGLCIRKMMQKPQQHNDVHIRVGVSGGRIKDAEMKRAPATPFIPGPLQIGRISIVAVVINLYRWQSVSIICWPAPDC